MSSHSLQCCTWQTICRLLATDPRWSEAMQYLTTEERENGVSLKRVWQLLDQGWFECREQFQELSLTRFLDRYYQHPVWLINAAFTESDPGSISDRQAAVRLISHVAPKKILDFGGGIGTGARLCALNLPDSELIDVVDITEHRQTVIRRMCEFPKVNVLKESRPPYDAIICTEVLEHVVDPIAVVHYLNSQLRVGGALAISYSFAPGIECHLPQNFHLARIMPWIIRCLGFGFYGFERRGSTMFGFVKRKDSSPNDIRKARLLGLLGHLPIPISRMLLALRGL